MIFFDDSRDEVLTKICPLCGDEFVPTNNRQKHCLSCKGKKKSGKKDEKKKDTRVANASVNEGVDEQPGDLKRAVKLLLALLDVADQLAKVANDFDLDYTKAYDCLNDAIGVKIKLKESDKK